MFGPPCWQEDTPRPLRPPPAQLRPALPWAPGTAANGPAALHQQVHPSAAAASVPAPPPDVPPRATLGTTRHLGLRTGMHACMEGGVSCCIHASELASQQTWSERERERE